MEKEDYIQGETYFDINFKKILNIFSRNKLFLFSISLISTLSTVSYVELIKPVFEGSVDILIKKNEFYSLLDSLNSKIIVPVPKTTSLNFNSQ